MRFIIVVFLFCSIAFDSIAQQNTAMSQNNQWQCPEMAGTYQLQLIGVRAKPSLPDSICDIIRHNRDSEKVVYYPLGTRLRLMILPFSDIEKATPKNINELGYVEEE